MWNMPTQYTLHKLYKSHASVEHYIQGRTDENMYRKSVKKEGGVHGTRRKKTAEFAAVSELSFA